MFQHGHWNARHKFCQPRGTRDVLRPTPRTNSVQGSLSYMHVHPRTRTYFHHFQFRRRTAAGGDETECNVSRIHITTLFGAPLSRGWLRSEERPARLEGLVIRFGRGFPQEPRCFSRLLCVGQWTSPLFLHTYVTDVSDDYDFIG